MGLVFFCLGVLAGIVGTLMTVSYFMLAQDYEDDLRD